jgi:glutathionylspermidine synthase
MTQSALLAKIGLRFPLSRDATKGIPFRFGPEICLETFREIQTQLCLDYFKWDIQIGDVSTLFRQPLLMQPDAWNELKEFSENLSAELFSMERELLDRPELWTRLGIPREIRNVLKEAGRQNSTKSVARTLRFDFHYTTEGWQISEVNSDVPGGHAEASAFTAMMASQFPGTEIAGDPADAWANAMQKDVKSCRNVALLSAPGFLEDQQVTMLLAATLEKRGIRTHLLHHPEQLKWKNGHASAVAGNASVALDAIVRFYQGEWLARRGKNNGWEYFFSGGETPISNYGAAILTESKRLPLLFNLLKSSSELWRHLLPDCWDPRETDWTRDDGSVLKATFSNTGDSVYFREHMPVKQWKKIVLRAQKSPEQWVVQRRFDPVRIESCAGFIYPCIGVFTINGNVAGIYARVSGKSTIDFGAMDAACLIAEK